MASNTLTPYLNTVPLLHVKAEFPLTCKDPLNKLPHEEVFAFSVDLLLKLATSSIRWKCRHWDATGNNTENHPCLCEAHILVTGA